MTIKKKKTISKIHIKDRVMKNLNSNNQEITSKICIKC